MDTTPKTPLETIELRALFVGSKEENFYIVRDVLRQRNSTIEAELEQVFSLEEAWQKIGDRVYDVVLFDAEMGKIVDGRLSEVVQRLKTVPFIVLEARDADEAALAKSLQAGAADWIAKSELNGRRLSHSIRGALALW